MTSSPSSSSSHPAAASNTATAAAAAAACSASSSAILRGPTSLPLLEGLCHRPVEEQQSIVVGQVLSQWTAMKRIARFVERTYDASSGKTEQQRQHGEKEETSRPRKRRRRGDSNNVASSDVSSTTSSTSKKGGKKKMSKKQQLQLQKKLQQQQQQEKEPSTVDISKNKISSGPTQVLPPSKPLISHWLIKSLASPSKTERIVACRLLVQGCPLDDFHICSLLEIIVQVLCNVELQKMGLTVSNSKVNNDSTVGDGGLLKNVVSNNGNSNDYVVATCNLQLSCTCFIGWIGLLKHILFHVLSPQQLLAYVLHPSSGLEWLCSTLWKLTSLGTLASQTQIHRGEYRTVCLTILDLIHALVLTGNDETVPIIHKILWTSQVSNAGANASTNQATSLSTGTSKDVHGSSAPATSSIVGLADTVHSSSSLIIKMSPMACLIGTYHTWKEAHREKFMEPYLSKLQKLTDPNVVPSPTKSNTTHQSVDNSSPGRSSLALVFDKGTSSRGNNNETSTNESTTKDSEPSAPAEPNDQDTKPRTGSEGDIVISSASGAGDRTSSSQDEKEEEEEEQANMDLEGNDEIGHGDDNIRSAVDDDDGEADGDHVGMEGIDEDEERSLESDIIDDEDEDEDEDMLHDDIEDAFAGFAQLEQLIDLQHSASTRNDASEPVESEGKEERSKSYIEAAMTVLATQYRPRGPARLLSVSSESNLLETILDFVKPQKKPLAGSIILRRAPSQEEFFPRNLSRNPVTFQMLTKGPNDGNQAEPTVRDLRQHIADDLQMSDAAEMIEILVANKIVDVDLKLRVVLQTVWKDHLMSQSSGSSSSGTLVSSMLASSAGRTRSFTIDAKNMMIATYRLCGVDGEATEDSVSSADLVDPEAPTDSSSPEDAERLLEKEYGLTRCVTKGRGVHSLLRSIERNVGDTLRKIRRDDIGGTGVNPTRQNFKDAVFPGLVLLVYASKLPSNRRMLLQARALTTLLSLMLDTLHALEEDGNNDSAGSNATAKSLQELIEVLASDISCNEQNSSDEDENESDEDIQRDASTLRHVVNALQSSSLSRPLRNVIAKLLPYLAYGKPKLAKELASEYMVHVDIESLHDYDVLDNEESVGGSESTSRIRSVLMDTFIHTSVSLPSNAVCDALRVELAGCGFIEKLTHDILSKAPTDPPPWSAGLFSTKLSNAKSQKLENKWKEFFGQKGLKLAFEIILGLSKGHGGVQSAVANSHLKGINFLSVCHWLESTSDKDGIQVKHLGLLGEALLDEIAENKEETSASEAVKQLRKATRDRKRQLAAERRNKTLMGINKFSGSNVTFAPMAVGQTQTDTKGNKESPAKKRKTSQKSTEKSAAKPAAKPTWMLEMENLEEEEGLTCAICQEGRVSKPKELLGLYSYVSRVALTGAAGTREAIEGWNMLRALPLNLPSSLSDHVALIKWHQNGKDAVEALQRIESRHPVSSSAASAISRRGTYYTTTVSAGNAIHTNCHAKARQADRNHPKAPKSEWEGAALRNNRCQTNIIFPLSSAHSSSISLTTLESAISDHQSAVSNLLGAMPQSILFNVLHDIRLLLLRLSYAEDISADVGGGSRKSNAQLLFYQLISADMHNNTSVIESPDFAEHARSLSSGFLAAVAISTAHDYKPNSTTSSASSRSASTSLSRGIADASTMAALTCILIHNNKNENTGAVSNTPSPNRRWLVGKDRFLVGLLQTAGLRHALGIKSSGCLPSRSIGTKRSRSLSFHDWDDAVGEAQPGNGDGSNKRSSNLLSEFGQSLRPFLCLFAMFNQLSADFVADMDDVAVDEASDRLVAVIEKCQRARDINELIDLTEVSLSHEEILKEFNKGILSA